MRLGSLDSKILVNTGLLILGIFNLEDNTVFFKTPPDWVVDVIYWTFELIVLILLLAVFNAPLIELILSDIDFYCITLTFIIIISC